MRRASSCAVLALALAGCAGESPALRQGSLALLGEPEVECDRLGPISVHLSIGLMMPDDSTLAAAVIALRREAALRGATHLVVARPPPRGVAYSTGATASGVAYRCAADR